MHQLPRKRRQTQSYFFFRSLSISAAAAVAAYDFSRFPVVVDVAGGHGEVLAAILRASPASRGVLAEIGHVAEGARERIAKLGLADRCEAVACDFFQSVPADGDLYVMKHIIHDWDDEAAAAILRTLRRSVKQDSRVMLVEWLIPETPGFHFGNWSDLVMMTGVGGRERTRGEFATLFRKAGFELEDSVPTASHYTIVIGGPS